MATTWSTLCRAPKHAIYLQLIEFEDPSSKLILARMRPTICDRIHKGVLNPPEFGISIKKCETGLATRPSLPQWYLRSLWERPSLLQRIDRFLWERPPGRERR